MSKSIIAVNLSKRYRLGLKEKQAKTFMGQLGNLIKSPWDNFQRLRKLSSFGEEDESVFWALRDVNFEVKEGEVLGIIGKNGAGKSTLLKILSQITEPTSGRVELHGRVASLLEVGTGFHPELTGRENIYMNGTILGMTRREIDRKLEEIIDFSGVEKFIDTPVKFYSSGMKVRLGFSVAAHLEPEILIVDEVLAVGDYEFQQKCLGKMEDVSRNQGRTVLFVSHNMAAVQTLCHKIILLEKGSVEYNGIIEEGINIYLSRNNIQDYRNHNSLIAHPNKKTGDRGMTSAKLLRKGKETDFLFSQEKFELLIEFNDDKLLNEIVFGLVIKDCNYVPVIGINNWDLGIRLNHSPVNKGTIRFIIESFPIYGSGLYFIDLFFGDGGDNYDVIESAVTFYLKPIDVFSNGKVLNTKLNKVFPGKVSMNLYV